MNRLLILSLLTVNSETYVLNMYSIGLLIFLLVLYQTSKVNAVTPTEPWQFFVEIGKKKRFRCAGAYISGYSRYKVLTRASCATDTDNNKNRVYIRDKDGRRYRTLIKSILVHEFYSKDKQGYDMALLELVGDFGHLGAITIDIPLYIPQLKCRIHKRDARDVESVNVELINLSRCKRKYAQLNATHQLENTFLCAKSAKEFCTKGNGFLVECDMYLIGIGIDDKACGVSMPYIMFDVVEFRDWVRYNKYPRTDAVTKIKLSNIYLTIIMLYCIVLNLKM